MPADIQEVIKTMLGGFLFFLFFLCNTLAVNEKMLKRC